MTVALGGIWLQGPGWLQVRAAQFSTSTLRKVSLAIVASPWILADVINRKVAAGWTFQRVGTGDPEGYLDPTTMPCGVKIPVTDDKLKFQVIRKICLWLSSWLRRGGRGGRVAGILEWALGLCYYCDFCLPCLASEALSALYFAFLTEPVISGLFWRTLLSPFPVPLRSFFLSS